MFQRMTNGGTFNDDHFDGLRSAALISIIEAGGVPSPVIEYMQACERRLLEISHQRKMEFVSTSWDQFLPKENA